jgi:hypothetical protein
MALNALTTQTNRPAPSVPAVANASAPQARVAIHRLYGCGAVTMAESSRRACVGHLARADATDQAVDGGQAAEVHRPGLDGVQRAGRRRRRPAICGDVNRRVDDVDLTPLDAVRGADGRHLVHRRGGGRSGRHQDGADVSCQIEHLADALVVRVVAPVRLCIDNFAKGVRRRIGFPNYSTQDLALTCPPWLARTSTGQLHSNPPFGFHLISADSTRSNERESATVPSMTQGRRCFLSHRQNSRPHVQAQRDEIGRQNKIHVFVTAIR